MRVTLPNGRVVCKGLVRTPAHQLLDARPFLRLRASPPNCNNSRGTKLQMDGNDSMGDCTCACIGNALDVIKNILGYAGGAISDANVVKWARAHGFQNGANIDDVLTTAQTSPLIDNAGQPNLLGPHVGVNYRDLDAVKEAISRNYFLDLGIDASILQSCVGNPGTVACAPIVTSLRQNIDHSVPVFDYGLAGYLRDQYADCYGAVTLACPQDTPCFGIATWSTMVIYPETTFLNSIGESWAVTSFPAPGSPSPAPGPGPQPNPGPPPGPRPTRGADRLVQRARVAGVPEDVILDLRTVGNRLHATHPELAEAILLALHMKL